MSDRASSRMRLEKASHYPAASLAAGIDRLKAAAADILTSAEEGWLDERPM